LDVPASSEWTRLEVPVSSEWTSVEVEPVSPIVDETILGSIVVVVGLSVTPGELVNT
jgi:hypothetical protein